MSFTYTIDNSGGNNDSGSDSNSVSTAGKWTIDSHTVTTPVLLVPSYIGNQLYSTPDNNNYISNRSLDPTANENSTQLVQIEIADFVQKDFNDVPLAKLYKQWNNNQVNVLSIRSTKYKTAMSSTNGISIDTVGGRKVISVDDYLKRILIDQPPVVIAFADELSINSGSKRISKAVERSMLWLKTISDGIRKVNDSNSICNYKPFFFGVALFNPNYENHLPITIEGSLNAGANGILIGGAFLGESDKQFRGMVADVRKELQNRNARLPLLVQGADTIEQVLLALSCRVDVISSNLASLSTQKGLALCFTSPNNEYSGDDSVVGEKRQAENVQGQRNKRVKLDNSIANAIAAKDTEEDVDSFGVINDATNSSSAFTRNLWDKKYREDKKPLVVGCNCHACLYHTRAYIHHLLLCKEMLAEILLYKHNNYEMLKLFELARDWE